MNAMTLVVDRLHAGYVGACGNTWIETPSLDRLTSESIIFERCLIESPRLDDLCRSYWQGWPPLCGPDLSPDRPSLASLLAAAGIATTLLTDEPAVAGHRLSGAFCSVARLDLPAYAPVADCVEETHLGRCFARIVDWLESAREPFLLWCHLTGLGGPWDAPLEFRARYAEDDDPDPPDSAEVPCLMLEEDYDPDQLLGISQAYAGQVSLLDVCVGALLEFFQASPVGQSTLLTLLSARGFPLGEHRRVGACDQSLYGELVHVPLWMRVPGSLGESVRSQALVQPADLCPTLLDWWGIADPPGSPATASLMSLAREEVESIRDRLCIVGDGPERAIRTPAWYLREAARPELFAKPDDRWEVNNVADRCDNVVRLLQDAFSDYERSIQQENIGNMRSLDEILLTGVG